MIICISNCKWKSWVSVCVFRGWVSGSCGLKRSKMLPLFPRWVWNSVCSVSTSYLIRCTTGTFWPWILARSLEKAKLAGGKSSNPRGQTGRARLHDIANQVWTEVKSYYYCLAPSMAKISAILGHKLKSSSFLEDLSPFTNIFNGIICWIELWFIFFRRWLSMRS